jgi:uncharacterized membrane protein
MAASAGNDQDLLQTGNDLILAGIGIQVATMCICGGLALDFFVRHGRMKRRQNQQKDWKPAEVFSHRRFLVFVSAEVFAFMVILVRCIYR